MHGFYAGVHGGTGGALGTAGRPAVGALSVTSFSFIALSRLVYLMGKLAEVVTKPQGKKEGGEECPPPLQLAEWPVSQTCAGYDAIFLSENLKLTLEHELI